MKKTIITIAGKPGSGKSTVAGKLAEKLKYSHFSSGDFFRQFGLDRGLDVMGLTNLAEKDKSVDELVDQKVRNMGKEKKIIVESRLAFHWIPDSFKVYLDLDTETCAKRIFADLQINPKRRASENCESVEEMTVKLIERFDSEKKRYSEIYSVNPQELSQYDLVINTKEISVEDVCKQVKESYFTWLGL